MSTPLRNATLAAALSLLLLPDAAGQASSGSIVGEANAGDQVEIRRDEIGFVRVLDISRDGKYTVRRLPTGVYTVTRTRADGQVGQTQTVLVQPGGSGRAR